MQVLKRMARKVRQAWQQDSAAAARRLQQQGQPEQPEVALPAWLEPRDGELFVEMQPLRHCGASDDAAWRRGYRNKLELAAGVTADGSVAVGVQHQHHGNGSREKKKGGKAGRGRGREVYAPTAVMELSPTPAHDTAAASDDSSSSSSDRPSAVSSEMLTGGKPSFSRHLY
jgi:hypothetical protein